MSANVTIKDANNVNVDIATDPVTIDTVAVEVQRTKVGWGVSGSYVDTSATNPLPVSTNEPDVIATGTITVTDSVVAAPAGAGAFVTGTSTAASYVVVTCPGGDSAWNVQVTGLTSGTLYFEGSLDSTNGINGNWINVNGRQTGIVNTVLAGSMTTNGMYRGNTSGLKYFRVRSVGALSGTPAVVIRLSGGVGAIFMNASIPTGSNVIGSTRNDADPSVLGVAQVPLRAAISQTATASTALVAAVVGKKIRVLAITLMAAGATNVTILRAATAISGAMPLAANTGFSADSMYGIFETAAGEALNMSMSASVQVSGFLTYITI